MGAHTHEEGHHHHDSFITKYIFSQDHKMISKQFLITAMVMGIVAVILSVLFRLQIAWPNEQFEAMKFFLGDSYLSEDGLLKPDRYLAIVTIHGTIMVFLY